ncbi:hypothetical protein, partial [Pseudomonas aeruginosa]|uniref:hypothetical protein n=1 Tax=Pseudomonas aeruginosa TaxID=287 RepID=UPI004054005E
NEPKPLYGGHCSPIGYRQVNTDISADTDSQAHDEGSIPFARSSISGPLIEDPILLVTVLMTVMVISSPL